MRCLVKCARESPFVERSIHIDAEDPHEPHKRFQIMHYGVPREFSSPQKLCIPHHDLHCSEREGTLLNLSHQYAINAKNTYHDKTRVISLSGHAVAAVHAIPPVTEYSCPSGIPVQSIGFWPVWNGVLHFRLRDPQPDICIADVTLKDLPMEITIVMA